LDSFTFSCVKVVFGLDRIKELDKEVRRVGGKKVVIITDITMKRVGEEICEILKEFDCELWSKVEPEPEIGIVDEVLNNTEFDTVVGVGGGSTLDVAKLSAVAAGKGLNISEFIGKELPERSAKLILCPTTAGTGSEVTKLAVFKIPGREVKYVFDSESLYADIAVVDPKLTLSAPPEVTANAGIDAICHAIEAYTSILANPVTDMFAEQAIKIGAKAVREAYSNGKNLKARAEMSYASLLAGIAFNVAGTSLGHALGYAHSYIHKSPHGRSVGITMPYVLQYNAIADLEKHAKISQLLGVDVDGMSLRDAALHSGVGFMKLLEDLCIPTKLFDVGAGEDDVDEIAERIFLSERHVSRNPRIVRKDDMRELVKKAIYGTIYGYYG
jgi:alcohol dehydrogenase